MGFKVSHPAPALDTSRDLIEMGRGESVFSWRGNEVICQGLESSAQGLVVVFRV